MRGTVMMFLLLLTGVIMTTIVEQSPAADEKSPAKIENYTEKVSVKQWDGKKFIKQVDDVPAFRTEIKGKTVIYITKQGVASPKGSEIIDKDNVTWVVTESNTTTRNFTYHQSVVAKKEDKP